MHLALLRDVHTLSLHRLPVTKKFGVPAAEPQAGLTRVEADAPYIMTQLYILDVADIQLVHYFS